jgi:hypothetical protein
LNSKLRSLIVSLIIAIILITALPAQTFAADAAGSESIGAGTTAITVNGATPSNPYIVDLIAGGGNVAGAKDVGDVLIWNDASNLYVKFVITTGDVNIARAQVQVATSPAGIPQSKGNPVPGQFDYKSPELGYVPQYTFTIPLKAAWTPTTMLYIAAHADVGRQGITSVTDFQPTLPDKVSFVVLGTPYNGGPSYLPDLCIYGGSSIDGHYNGWCVDSLHSIYVNANSRANVYSSYETLPSSITQAGIIAHPENLGAVNWVINQNFVASGAYTYGEVQFAIWMLLINPDPIALKDSPIVNQYLGDGYVANAVALYNNALTHTSYVPVPGEKLVVILVPVDAYGNICGQVCIIPICIPCIPGISETAWAAYTLRDGSGKITALGYPFLGKNWATYISYTI